jgi:nucleotide-binding universal stress UspA family protein
MASSDQRIVVGVDDSSNARRALGWALEEAALLGVELDVVHVYSLPVILMPAPVAAPTIDPDDYKWAATDLLQRLTSEAVAVAARRPPAIQQIAVDGQPARTLVTCSKPGDRLVVGSRGRGAVSSVLLGSVSHYCVHHAQCPVVVVPPGSEA